MIRFTVPGTPVAQPRPKAVSIGGKARVYGAKKSHPIHEFKAAVRMAFSAACGERLAPPIRVRMKFVLPRPKSMFWKRRPTPREEHDCKPDLDNMAKAVLDALTNAGAWQDDSQVYSVEMEKWIADGTEQPHVEIWISRGGIAPHIMPPTSPTLRSIET